MASSYQGISDTNLSTAPYTQDYGFLQSNLMRSNQQYEQGLSQVKNDYSSVLSTPTLGQAANDRKQQYISQVQEGLKKVATTDLSMPQNVAQAENLYQPFWKDQDLLANSSLARYYQGETQKLDQWEGSTDKDTRAQYNQYSRMDLQNGMEQVANSPFDKNVYMRLPKRSATPFYNIDADVDEAWQKEQGTGKDNGVSTTTTNGFGAMLTEYNGIKSKDAYKTYYLSKMASGKYDPQIAVIARVQNEQSKHEILQNNPGITEQEVNQQLAQEYVHRLGNSYKNNGDTYTNMAQIAEKKLKEVTDQVNNNQRGVSDNIQKGYIQQYTAKATEYRDEAGKQYQKYWNDYSPVTINGKPNDNYNKNLQDITEHPDDHIAHLQRDYMAEQWAIGRASISSEKKEIDPVWKEYQDIAWHRDQLNVDRQRIQAELRGQTLDYEGKTGRTLQGQQLPGFDPASEHGWYGEHYGSGNPSAVPVGRVLGEHTIELGKLPEGLDVIHKFIQGQETLMNDQYYNPSKGGIANTVLSQLGFGLIDITKFTESAKRGMDGSMGPDGSNLYNKVWTSLKEHGVDMSKITGPRSMITALDTYATNVVEQLSNSHNTSDYEKAVQLAEVLSVAHVSRDKFIKTQKNFDQSVHDELVNNPLFQKAIVTDSNGNKRPVSANDLTPYTSQLHLTDERGRELPGEELANAWINGNVKEVGGGEQNLLEVNGKTYQMPYKFDQFSNNNSSDVYNNLVNRFGKSEDLKNMSVKAANLVVPKLRDFKNGIIAKEIAYDPNSTNEREAKFAQDLGPEIALPANTEGKPYYYKPGTNEKQYLSPELEQTLRGTLTTDLKSKAGPIGKTMNDEGSEVYVVHFKQPKDDPEAASFPLAGKTIFLKESANAQGPTMAKIPQNSGLYLYGDILDGGSYKADPTMKKLGIDWDWVGYDKNSLGQATKSNIEIRRTIKDPNTPHKYINLQPIQTTIYHTGSDAKTVDETGAALRKQEINHLVQSNENNKNAHKNIINTN